MAKTQKSTQIIDCLSTSIKADLSPGKTRRAFSDFEGKWSDAAEWRWPF